MSHFQNFFEERHEDSKGFKEDSSPATNASKGVTTVDLNMYCLHVLERDYNPRLHCRICHINTMPFKWPELLWNTNLNFFKFACFNRWCIFSVFDFQYCLQRVHGFVCQASKNMSIIFSKSLGSYRIVAPRY